MMKENLKLAMAWPVCRQHIQRTYATHKATGIMRHANRASRIVTVTVTVTDGGHRVRVVCSRHGSGGLDGPASIAGLLDHGAVSPGAGNAPPHHFTCRVADYAGRRRHSVQGAAGPAAGDA